MMRSQMMQEEDSTTAYYDIRRRGIFLEGEFYSKADFSGMTTEEFKMICSFADTENVLNFLYKVAPNLECEAYVDHLM